MNEKSSNTHKLEFFGFGLKQKLILTNITCSELDFNQADEDFSKASNRLIIMNLDGVFP